MSQVLGSEVACVSEADVVGESAGGVSWSPEDIAERMNSEDKFKRNQQHTDLA